MAEEIDSEQKIKSLEFRVANLESEVQKLIRAAQQSAKAVNHLQSVTPKQMIRRT